MLSVPLVQPCSLCTTKTAQNCAEVRGRVWCSLHYREPRCGVRTAVNCPKSARRVPTPAARSY
eukprot:2398867-Prymnesium_polylepis.1